MSVWAYVCHACEGDPPARWFVPVTTVAEMPGGTRIVRVRVGEDWLCAVVDLDRVVEVEQMLARDVIASSAEDCPGCGERARAAPAAEEAAGRSEREPGAEPRGPTAQPRASSAPVQAAAISLQGRRMVVVIVSPDLVRSPGEADMAIEALSPGFGGVPVVLVAQEEDGSPRYYGDPELVGMLHGIPLERMPWKEYPAG